MKTDTEACAGAYDLLMDFVDEHSGGENRFFRDDLSGTIGVLDWDGSHPEDSPEKNTLDDCFFEENCDWEKYGLTGATGLPAHEGIHGSEHLHMEDEGDVADLDDACQSAS